MNTDPSGTRESAASGSIKSVLSYACAEIVEKKSRFIGEAFPVKSAEEAQRELAAVQKKYHDARHHCHAFVIGTRGEMTRSSDNGEPAGTAGRPILEVITGNGLTDTLVVVTRYFGGVLLGTGGLVRAYSAAAKAVLAAAAIREMRPGHTLTVRVAYPLADSVARCLQSHALVAETPVYEADVRLCVFVPAAQTDSLINDLTNICSGNIVIERSAPHYA